MRSIRTDADRIRWALTFANEESSALRGGARRVERLRNGLAAFLGVTGRGVEPPGGFGIRTIVVRPPYPWDLTKTQLFRLQRDARHLIDQAIDGKGVAPTEISGGKDQPIIMDAVNTPDGRVPRIGGSVRSTFLLALTLLLAGRAGAPVRRCPECRKLFVRVRRQLYCASSCTNKAGWRNYPEEKKRRAREKQYAKFGWKLGSRRGGSSLSERGSP